MNFLFYTLQEEIIQALGWTLLHSAWQAAVISLLLGFLLVILQRSSKLRYVVCVSGLTLVLFSAITTFLLYYQTLRKYSTEHISENRELIINESTTDLPPAVNQIDKTTSDNIIYKYKTYFIPHFPLIITIWFLGILLLSLRFLGSLAYTQRLKRYRVVDITDQWVENLKTIADKIGLQKPIRLLESSLVTVPMVVGYLKPVILFPVGAIAGLSVKQVESILAHELAHIYRKDYLVNIFQTVIEILFFYHPAIWWMSSRMREEREHCCDDIAVKVNENSLIYAKALTKLGEMHIQTSSLAMAATGSNGVLFKRIKRLLTQNGQTPTFSEGFITAFILVVCIFSLSFIAKASFTSGNETPMANISSYKDQDFNATILNAQDSTGKDNNLIIIKNKKGKIVDLFVNGKKIPRAEIKNYSGLIEKSLAQQESPKPGERTVNAEDKAAVQQMLSELEEENEELKADRPERIERSERREHTENREKHHYSWRDSAAVMNNFTRKTLEIAKLGMEMGQLSMELESLQLKMKKQDGNNKNYKQESQRLQNKLDGLQLKIESLGKELEESGTDLGSMSIDIAKDVLEGLKFNFDFEHEKDEKDKSSEDK